jgi:3-dehydroshikimate dehydratase
MLYGGLVSITFRQLQPREIITLVQKSGLKGIEWGGDVHVPHGNLHAAREVGHMTREAGLTVAAYGSYYRVGCQGQEGVPDFRDVLETALELEAPLIRVWAGNIGSERADQRVCDRAVEDSIRIGDMAKGEDIIVAYEYHSDTLTDTLESNQRLINEVNHPNVRSYWQPLAHHDIKNRMDGLEQILSRLENVHVYHWIDGDRLPLEDGYQEWRQYLRLLRDIPGQHYALIEFVKGDRAEQFLEDAETLKRWLGEDFHID